MHGEISIAGRSATLPQLHAELASLRLKHAGVDLFDAGFGHESEITSAGTLANNEISAAGLPVRLFEDAGFTRASKYGKDGWIFTGGPEVVGASQSLDAIWQEMGLKLALPANWKIQDMATPGGHNYGPAVILTPPRNSNPDVNGVIVESDPANGRSLSEYLRDSSKGFGGKDLTASYAIKICQGRQDGWIWKTKPDRDNLVSETVFSINRGKGIAVSYAHLAGHPELAQVRSAVENVCLL
ncbi:MAG: hypothetical protein NVSMB31_05860 [Vulcanimicrobiaceae bacterium]